MKKVVNICVLSGLVIPEGKFSREHYLAKSLCPYDIANMKENIFPALDTLSKLCVFLDVSADYILGIKN